MDVLDIPQEKASQAMMAVGICEVVSRLVTSYLGDYIKGRILYVYVVFCLILGLQNALGSLAYTYLHLVIYSAGKEVKYIGRIASNVFLHFFVHCNRFNFVAF